MYLRIFNLYQIVWEITLIKDEFKDFFFSIHTITIL